VRPAKLDRSFGVKVYPAPCGKQQAHEEIDKLGPDELTYLDNEGNEFVLDDDTAIMAGKLTSVIKVT